EAREHERAGTRSESVSGACAAAWQREVPRDRWTAGHCGPDRTVVSRRARLPCAGQQRMVEMDRVADIWTGSVPDDVGVSPLPAVRERPRARYAAPDAIGLLAQTSATDLPGVLGGDHAPGHLSRTAR